MKHILILTGGYLNATFAREYIRSLSYDRLFVVDKGLEYAQELGLIPDYVVGDFDTVNMNVLAQYEKQERQGKPIVIERHPAKKNATDTEIAVWEAMEENATVITLLGATGSRLDHVLANVGLLKQTVEHNIFMQVVDETNRIQIVDGKFHSECRIRREEQFGTYISLLSLTDTTEGVTLQGACYPLTNATIYRGSSRTISNEIAEDEIIITIRKGQALVIESQDTWR